MAGNRAKTQDFILRYIERIAPGGDNLGVYKKLFASMNDKQFDAYIDELDKGTKWLVVFIPNFTGAKVSVENNLRIAEELGHNFFQRLWVGAKGSTPEYLTPVPYLVMDLPLRRASQMLTKKISIPEHNRTVDKLTGQPTGAPKGAKISYPELQVAAAMNLDNCMLELMKYRGGDRKGGDALKAMIGKYGTANLKTLSNFASGVESGKTLKTFLTCMHLKVSGI